MKTSGFNIEDTHLTDIDRIEKLVALITIAFCWAYLVGIYLHEHEKPIKILNNGKRRKSFFKYGLTFIASVLLNAGFQSNIDIFKFLSCTYNVFNENLNPTFSYNCYFYTQELHLSNINLKNHE